jgi:hypothetical protein
MNKLAEEILSKVDPTNKRGVNILGIKNAIHEFGDFLPDELLTPKRDKADYKFKIVHQEPDFSDF